MVAGRHEVDMSRQPRYEVCQMGFRVLFGRRRDAIREARRLNREANEESEDGDVVGDGAANVYDTIDRRWIL